MSDTNTPDTNTTQADASVSVPVQAAAAVVPATKKAAKQRTCKCIITGAERMVRPDVLEKRIARYGSAEKLAASYVCTESKQLLRSGKTVDQIRAEYKITNPDVVVPTAPVPQDIIDEIMAKAPKPKKDTAAAAAPVDQSVTPTPAIDVTSAPVDQSGDSSEPVDQSGEAGAEAQAEPEAEPAVAAASAESEAQASGAGSRKRSKKK